jgi:hypothetical protein
MARPSERPAIIVALVNAIVVYLLPLAFVAAVSMLAPLSNGTHVVGVDPDRARVWATRIQLIAAYLLGLLPFAMAAAWRTFVYARRWLEHGSHGLLGILEGGLCGLAGAVLVLLPASMMKPTQAPPYLIAYGGMAAILGLAVGLVLWVTGSIAVRLVPVTRPGPRSTS